MGSNRTQIRVAAEIIMDIYTDMQTVKTFDRVLNSLDRNTTIISKAVHYGTFRD